MGRESRLVSNSIIYVVRGCNGGKKLYAIIMYTHRKRRNKEYERVEYRFLSMIKMKKSNFKFVLLRLHLQPFTSNNKFSPDHRLYSTSELRVELCH